MRLSLISLTAVLSLALAGVQPGSAWAQDPLYRENAAERLSAHVFIVRGNPNIGIVVGDKATLVVDTGMGAANGAVIARTVAGLAKGSGIYLITTHFHPEHASGEGGFPKGTILIRPRAQQAELEADKGAMLARFSARSPDIAKLLAGVVYRTPDITFDHDYSLDLGGVRVRLIWTGPAHTRGDAVVFVEGDGVMITGDVVQNRVAPAFTAAGVGPKDWLAAVDAIAPLKPTLILPDHSPPGDGSLVTLERAFLAALIDRAAALKSQGKSAADAGPIVTAEMKAAHPDWQIRDLSDAVARAYAQ